MSILVTGGTGYIGSHTVVELLETGEKVIVLDNFSNSNPSVIHRIKEITGKDFLFYEADILDEVALDKIFEENSDIEVVIHFAGLKAVGESMKKPLDYYYNNVTGTTILLQVMKKHSCKKMVFSSSATVYGVPKVPKITEEFETKRPANPYGTTKLMIEEILEDLYTSDPEWSIALLRYFNPIGAHKSGKIGESPNGIPNNLMPYITQVAYGKLEHLNVFGNDYNTHDGTGVRDYIHVVDLAKGHLKAIDRVREENKVYKYNLGTGHPYSVLDIIYAFEKVNDIKIKYEIAPRRLGDIDEYYA